jgi:hypothetical protein
VGQPVDGRARFCASQEGSAIYSLLVLGLADARVERLVERPVRTQWPDGGWNCDRRTEADTSSFHETWLPLRALVRYARLTGSLAVRAVADRAAEIFLSRSLFQRRSDGAVMRPSFVQLHYPAYWHYDLLAGLTVMAEGGYIHDARCGAALDLLCAKQLADGGFPAEAAWYRLSDDKVPGRSLVPWGTVQPGMSDPWVTVEALSVLRAARRLGELP